MSGGRRDIIRCDLLAGQVSKPGSLYIGGFCGALERPCWEHLTNLQWQSWCILFTPLWSFKFHAPASGHVEVNSHVEVTFQAVLSRVFSGPEWLSLFGIHVLAPGHILFLSCCLTTLILLTRVSHTSPFDPNLGRHLSRRAPLPYWHQTFLASTLLDLWGGSSATGCRNDFHSLLLQVLLGPSNIWLWKVGIVGLNVLEPQLKLR